LPSPEFRFYAITDRQRCAPRPLIEVVGELLDAGVRGFQIREKDLEPADLALLACPIVRLCRHHRARVLINSHLQVALDIGADGVHLPAAAQMRVEHRELLVGRSIHSLEEAEGEADFFVYSPIFPTPSKPGVPAKGLEGLRRVAQASPIPVFALGGVTPERVEGCLQAGAFGVAAISGLMRPEGAGVQARAYLEQLTGVLQR